MPTRSSKPRDVNALAFAILQEATGEAAPTKPESLRGKKADSQKGGLRGGKSRMDALTPEQRQELAKKAAAARWSKPAPDGNAGAGKVKG